MRRAVARTLARCSWVLIAGLTGAAACGYPGFEFVPTGGGTGGIAGSASGLGGSAGTSGSAAHGGAGTGGSAGIVAGEGGEGDAGGAGGAPVAAGGAGGADPCEEAGPGGGGGAGGAEVPNVCADYPFVPASCTCHEYDAHAYFFCNAYRSFEAASTFCGGNDGMQLVRIEDSQENGWIVATATARQPPLEYYWIGGTSEGTPASWRWVDGTSFWEGGTTGDPVCGRFVDWRPSSPTDPAITEPDEDCMQFNMDGWDDVPCTDSRMYICEWY